MKAFRFLSLFSVILPLLSGCAEKETLEKTTLEVEDYGKIPAQGGEFTIKCIITNPFEYGILRVYCDADWIGSAEISDGNVVLVADENTEEADRETVLRLTYPECDPLEITVVQEHYDPDAGLPVEISLDQSGELSVKASFSPLRDDRTYYTGCVPAYKVSGDHKAFIDSVLSDMEQEAADAGLHVSAIIAEYVSEGPAVKEFSSLLPETDYVVYAFGLGTDGKADASLNVEEFRTGAYPMPDVAFALEKTSVSQTTVTMRCTPSDTEVHYIYHYASAQEYETIYGGNDSQLIAEMIEECRADLEYYNSQGMDFTFWDFCDTGVKERQFKKFMPDTEYLFFAFALGQDGSALSPVSKVSVRTDKEEITDDCTFGITFSDIRSDSFDVKIVPSDNSTRYYAYLAGSAILETYTPEKVASLMISMANDSGIDWSDSRYVFTGTRNLDSYDDLGSPLLDADSPYTVFVFGVNSFGERTTEVAYAECVTAPVEMSDMTIDFQYTVNGPSSVDVVYVPSSQEGYFYGCITASEYESASSEEELIDSIIARSEAEGSFIPVSGRHEHQLRGNYLRASTEYVLYAFGYSGDVTTRLFTKKFSTPERVFSAASMNIGYSIIDGDEIYQQNPSVNYAYRGRAAVVFTVEPSEYAASWFFSGFGNSRSYLEALDKEELLYTIEMNGRKNYNKREAMYAADWNSVICCAGYAMDSAGKEGSPVIIEVRVPGKN